MSASKRKCATCKYFQVSPVSGQGWCTQPTRQTSNDVRLLVRKDELNCRNSWGNDLWVDASAPDTAIPPITPAQPVDDVILPFQKLDDEITSVVSTDATSRLDPGDGDRQEERTQRDDVVVREASLVPETVTAMSMSEATDKNADDSRVVARDNDGSYTEEPTVVEREAALNARDRLRRRRTIHFDFNPSTSEASPDISATADDVNGARIVDQASEREISQPSRPTLNQRVEDTRPVASAGSDRRQEMRAADKLYDSVPDIDPEFELPRAERPQVSPNRNLRSRKDLDTIRDGQSISSYDAALQRAQEFRSSPQGQRAGRRNDRLPITPAIQPERKVDMALPEPPRRALAKPEPVIQAQVRQVPVMEPEVSVSPHSATYRPVVRTPQFDVQSLVRRNITFQRTSPVPEPTPDAIEQAPSSMAGDRQRSARTRLRLGFPLRRQSSRDHGRRSDASVADTQTSQGQAFNTDGLTYLDDQVSEFDVVQPFGESSPPLSLQETAHPEQPTSSRSLYGKKSDLVPNSPRDGSITSRSSRPNQIPAERDDAPDRIVEPRESQAHSDQRRNVQIRAEVQESEDQRHSAIRTASVAPSPMSWSFEPLPDLRQESGMRELRSRIGIENNGSRSTSSGANSSARSRAEENIADARGRSIVEDQIVARRSPTTEIDSLHRSSAFRASTFSIRESIPEMDERRSQEINLPAGTAPYRGEQEDSFDHPSQTADPEFDIRDALWFDEEEVTSALQLAPDVPRQCQTCRDYRPSESGGRGWCTNGWAFEHRQMVNANDLACQSTIGCWWLPFDDVWLPNEPVSTPTPLVAQMVTAALERRRSS